MSLKDEIQNKRREIVVDSYPMSIGEMSNLYRDEELDVHPEFQRFFRWDDNQKTRLIESVLLGIPIPPIFVSQRTDGKWDVIDGQQRLSTILQFLQLLKKDDGEPYPPLTLSGTRFLPSLQGVTWNDDNLFSSDLRIIFKRAKLDFTIIKESEGNESSKYEMFQRLNTGGTHLSPQEIRNCLLIMINKPLYEDILSLSGNNDFIDCIPLSDNQNDEQYNLELIVKSIIFSNPSLNGIVERTRNKNMDEFVTAEIEKFASTQTQPIMESFKNDFTKVFKILNNVVQENAFKRFQDGRYKGAFLMSAFESIVPGLLENVEYWESHQDNLEQKIKLIYEQLEYIDATRRGVRPIDRMTRLVSFSKRWFSNASEQS